MIGNWFDEGALYKFISLFYPAKKSELGAVIEEKNANGKNFSERKKRKLLKLLNTFGVIFAEKELVRVILGYAPSNPKTIKQTIRHSSLTSEEKAYLIEKIN